MESAKFQEDINNIPQANDDPQVIINDETKNNSLSEGNSSSMIQGRSMDSVRSTFINGSSSALENSSEPHTSSDLQEEKARLMLKRLEMQRKIKILAAEVESLQEQKLMLQWKNQVHAMCIENLRQQSTSSEVKRE